MRLPLTESGRKDKYQIVIISILRVKKYSHIKSSSVVCDVPKLLPCETHLF